MKTIWRGQKGTAVIYVLMLSVVLSATLSVIWTLLEMQRKLVLSKEHFLRAKFGSEGAIYKYLDKLSHIPVEELQSLSEKTVVFLSATDSAEICAENWGGYLWISARSQVKNQSYGIQTLAGLKPGYQFNPALILSPQSPVLITSGHSRIVGDVRCGMKGVKSGSLNQNNGPEDKMVSGRIYPSYRDHRPLLNRGLVKALLGNFEKELSHGFDFLFTDLIPDSSTIVAPGVPEYTADHCYLIDNSTMNMRPWQISGPLILIASEPLIITAKVKLTNRVQLLSAFPIIIQGEGIFRDVILYSRDQVKFQQVNQFQGQIFSGNSIEINHGVQLDYPSLLLVHNPLSQGSIHLHPGSRVSGCLAYLSHLDSLKNSSDYGSVIIDSSATLHGLSYSDCSTRLAGCVQGTVITDRFDLIYFSTRYINWINDGMVQRNRLSDRFKLPLIFNSKNRLLSPIKM